MPWDRTGAEWTFKESKKLVRKSQGSHAKDRNTLIEQQVNECRHVIWGDVKYY